ncbi:MAG: hypothetical protein ABIH52_04195 [Candidatus Aenigmatarchaeota archaeon]
MRNVILIIFFIPILLHVIWSITTLTGTYTPSLYCIGGEFDHVRYLIWCGVSIFAFMAGLWTSAMFRLEVKLTD